MNNLKSLNLKMSKIMSSVALADGSSLAKAIREYLLGGGSKESAMATTN